MAPGPLFTFRFLGFFTRCRSIARQHHKTKIMYFDHTQLLSKKKKGGFGLEATKSPFCKQTIVYFVYTVIRCLYLLSWRVFMLSKMLDNIQDFHLAHLPLKYIDKQSRYEVNKRRKSKRKMHFLSL